MGTNTQPEFPRVDQFVAPPENYSPGLSFQGKFKLGIERKSFPHGHFQDACRFAQGEGRNERDAIVCHRSNGPKAGHTLIFRFILAKQGCCEWKQQEKENNADIFFLTIFYYFIGRLYLPGG